MPPLALALSIAEAVPIQQTSIAPMAIQLKGITYARAFGLNYVDLFWALVYETVFVVYLPIYLTEIISSTRQNELWIGKRGVIITSILFSLGALWDGIRGQDRSSHCFYVHQTIHLLMVSLAYFQSSA